MTPWDTHQAMVAGNTTFRTASYALTMSDHSGTHVDAFKHFGPGGEAIDEMPLEVRPCILTVHSLLPGLQVKAKC